MKFCGLLWFSPVQYIQYVAMSVLANQVSTYCDGINSCDQCYAILLIYLHNFYQLVLCWLFVNL